MGNMPLPNNHKKVYNLFKASIYLYYIYKTLYKPENNNNILDMILSAAMKVKKDPSTTETRNNINISCFFSYIYIYCLLKDHKIPMKVFAECEDEKRMRGVHKHEMKEKTSDSSCIKKSIKKNGKIYMEHTNRGNS